MGVIAWLAVVLRLRVHGTLYRLCRDRQRADAGAAGVEDRVAECGRDHGHRRLADAGGFFAVGNDADGDFRQIGRASCRERVFSSV